MTLGGVELGLYALAMAGLWAVPGPVWVALVARSLSGGFAAAWPLAVGVTLGDALWPLLAILGMGWVLSVYGDALHVLRIVAAVTFLVMGALLMRSRGALMGPDSRLTRPGALAGFLTGVAAVIGNPKAILFYMGVLPGFFGDLSRLMAGDIAAVMAVSVVIPLVGNLLLALFLDRVRRLLSSPAALRRMNLVSGGLLMAVGLAIPFI